MTRTRRSALATGAAALAVSTALAATPAVAAPGSHATKLARAQAAVKLFEKNGFADLGLPSRHATWVRACYLDVCARDRLRADPECDPAAGACIGTALRGVRVTSKLTVVATYF